MISSVKLFFDDEENVQDIASLELTSALFRAYFRLHKDAVVYVVETLKDDFKEKLTSYKEKYPTWMFPESSCDLHLTDFVKASTTSETFEQHRSFLSKNIDSKWLFTDASKNDSSTAYAVVDNSGQILGAHTLRNAASIFTAEAAGILHAINIAKNSAAKTIIFTDSLSVIKAVCNIANNKWASINNIRDLLIDYKNKITLFWIPGHVGLTGNVYADSAAKYACSAPLVTDTLIEKVDLKKVIKSEIKAYVSNKYKDFTHPHYNIINPENLFPIYSSKLEKRKIRIFSRLRMGHTVSTHLHLLNRNFDDKCTKCNNVCTVRHILSECPSLHQEHNLILHNKGLDILKTPTIENVNTVFEFISYCKIPI
ncbi:allatostatin double C isoform X2 [Musca autumnalis]|uniref:allatostatin double C isoform X2 n=1 Tax=Musca autumnalis TaxID=221902 RepID=UPI003CE94294